MTEHRLRQELDQLLREDTKIFDFLESSTLDGMWFWDLENPEEEWMSETFWRTFGYDPSEKQHLASEWQDMINPDDLALALENFNAHCADPNHPYDQIVRYRHKDGSTVWVRCRGMAIRDESGKPIRMLGAHTNITGLKALEQSTFQRIEHENKILDHQNRVRERLERIANIGTWELEVETSGLYWSDQIKRIHEVPEDYVPTLESGISFYAPGESQST
ncbi:MAG: PAS domain-containing protein, partial [Halieaceae bacterium]|nr:PAS domain-containing protein [Halieaceae bacterium]